MTLRELLFLIFALATFVTSPFYALAQTATMAPPLIQEYQGIDLSDKPEAPPSLGLKMTYKMKHFSSIYNLKIELWYDENSAGLTPDPLTIKKSIVDFLEQYPNETDWWEEMNKNLVVFLAQKYPDITDVKSNLDVTPSIKIPYDRTSLVELDNHNLKEGFGFKLHYVDGLKNFYNNASLDVSYTYVEGLGMKDHPDFRTVGGLIDNYIAKNLKSADQWDTFKPNLIQYIKERFPVMKTLEIKIITR